MDENRARDIVMELREYCRGKRCSECFFKNNKDECALKASNPSGYILSSDSMADKLFIDL